MIERTLELGRGLAVVFVSITLFAVAATADELPQAEASGTNITPANATAPALAQYKHMSLEELMNQEVTSVSKGPERFQQAPAAIQVVTGEDIRRFGASSLPEALRLAGNLDVAQNSSAGWNISARGFNSSVGNKLLVLMDGRSIYTPLFSGVIWNMQDYLLEDLDRIEVISGPGSSLWGANAVNGVINIVSKDAKDTQGTYLEAGAGTWLRDFTGIRYGGMISSNVFFRVYGKYFDRESEVFRDGTDANDDWWHAQGGFRIDAEASVQDHLTLQGDLYGGETGATPGGEGMPTATGSESGGNLLGRWTHAFGDDTATTLQLYYDRTQLGAPFQSSGVIPAGMLHDTLDTYDLDFQDTFALGDRNKVVWGLGYRHTHDLVHDAPLVAFVPEALDQDLFSAFVQDEIKLFDDVYLTLGTKLEHNDYTGFEVEPSARLQWNITDKETVWAAVSRAVRAPSRYDRDLLEPSPQYGPFLGNTNGDFQSEDVVAFELGYRAQLAEQFSGAISVFYNEYDHLRSLAPTPVTVLPLMFQNDLEGHTYGLELTGDYQALDWWRLHMGYDYLGEHIHVRPGGVDLFNALNETADPRHQVFLRSAMDLPGNLEFDADWRWIASLRSNNGGTAGHVPSYAELNLRLAWHATKNLELAIVGENLLHNRHPEAGFPGPAQEEITRSVYGKVTLRF